MINVVDLASLILSRVDLFEYVTKSEKNLPSAVTYFSNSKKWSSSNILFARLMFTFQYKRIDLSLQTF